MIKNTLNVFGHAIGQDNHQGIAGLRVEADSGEAKASAVTDERGDFTITFNQSEHPSLFEGQSAEIAFTLKVFKGSELIQTTKATLPRNGESGNGKVEIVVGSGDAALTVIQSQALATAAVVPVAKHIVKGTVRTPDGAPFAGGRVRAFDDNAASPLLLGEELTDQQGNYLIEYPPQPQAENLRVQLFDNNNRLLAEAKRTPAAPAEVVDFFVQIYIVRGSVRRADGAPLVSGAVQAFDCDLRNKQLLGASPLDGMGRYEIQFSLAQFENRERGGADLLVKIDQAGKELVTSPILFNAPPIAEIDLTVPATSLPVPPLFNRIRVALDPLLGDVKITELEENVSFQDVSFLAGETIIDKTDIARFIMAHKSPPLPSATLLPPPEFWFVLFGGSFFTFAGDKTLQEQLTLLLDALPAVAEAEVRKSITRGFNLNEIATVPASTVDAWVTAFLDFVTSQMVNPDAKAKPTFVKLALDDAKIGAEDKREKFALLFNRHKGLTPALLDELAKDPTFSKAEIDDVHASFLLADVTRGGFPVVKAIKTDFGVRSPLGIRALAGKSEAEWVALVKRHDQEIELPLQSSDIAGNKPPAAESYGKTLAQQFRETFPTAAFAGGLDRAPSSKLPNATELKTFLAQHQDFELLNTSVDEFFKTSLQGLTAPATNEEFKLALKAVQRVFKLAPTYEATEALIGDGLHSAQQIYRMGESEFVRRHGNRTGLGAEDARRVWQRAADTHAAALTIVADLKSLEAEGLPRALETDSDALKTFPNWDNLFQAGDLCECEQCRSVLSPAAYFADLLMFLKDRKAVGSGSVKDILLDRRPDLGYIDLNCENASTPLPYIDVVCEVLEDAVAHDDVDLGFNAMSGNEAADKTTIRSGFEKKNIKLGDFSLTRVNKDDTKDNRWVVRSDGINYLLDKNGTGNFFARVLRNTKASAEELRAYPQYVNAKAYEQLSAAKYPMNLPFDLFGEEVRAGFQKSNLQRWDLMRTFRSSSTDPRDVDIAAEYFGISAKSEKGFILTKAETSDEQKAFWNERSIPGDLSNVKVFLQKTALEYNELLALFDLRFIRANGVIFIDRPDPSCDTEKMTIKKKPDPAASVADLEAADLDRIHRFLRLWRKLKGWKMWELDLVIQHIGKGNLDEGFLTSLMYFAEVRKKLGISIEQAAGLFGNINFETHFTRQHEKREDALYQSLFLNKRLIQPLDPAFEIDPAGNLKSGEKISNHRPTVLAALHIHEADLVLLDELNKATDHDDLKLANLSFLWRHALLCKQLNFKAEEWKTVLKLLGQNLAAFADPKTAGEFLEKIDHLKGTSFTVDELNWLLAADRTAKAAVKEADAVRFLTALRKDLQTIQVEYDPANYPFLASRTEEQQLVPLLTSLLQKLGRDDAGADFFIDTLRGNVVLEAEAKNLPAAFTDFPPAITGAPNHIPIQYDQPNHRIRFTGIMTSAQKAVLLSVSDVKDIKAYQDAIEELFQQSQTARVNFLSIEIVEPTFSLTLPAEQPSLPIHFDAATKKVSFIGLMTAAEQTALKKAGNLPAIIDELFARPRRAVRFFDPAAAGQVWLSDSDLDATLPANNTFAKRLANTAQKALVYLSTTLSENLAVQQSSDSLVLPAATTRSLMTRFRLTPDAALSLLTGDFVKTTGLISNAPPYDNVFKAWHWLNRVAQILKQWKITFEDLEHLISLTTNAGVIDFLSLPLNESNPVAPIDKFLRTSRLLRLRESLPETGITFFEVLEKLNGKAYTDRDAFAADVQLLTDTWLKNDVKTLIDSLDPSELKYPESYLLAESWERLRRAFYFLESLNGKAATVKTFAAPTMVNTDAAKLKELLRSKFEEETWLALSAEIQDALRERKRDALAAWLLTNKRPSAPPTGAWETTNDLYAYYLIDVEMCSCMMTSRLVRASGTVQLLVQRCFMGLEPSVTVKADGPDGDSAWRWWKWMSKYRVWEANRKVFLWPENWIEPELRRDKSPFFKDLENELLQNEITQETVETAFINYLQKLHGVAQLEIAGYYQEDDGDNAILHLFGRTPAAAEPHLYYYRCFNYRQWTPWEKVDLDIQGDYLIPAVVNKRLYLFWPTFTEVPDEAANQRVQVPKGGEPAFPMQQTAKRLRIQMAMSEYRQGRWTSKKTSKGFVSHPNPSGPLTAETGPYTVEIIKSQYKFFPIDRSEIDGRFGIRCNGYSVAASSSDTNNYALVDGAFEISGCNGTPEPSSFAGGFSQVMLPEWDSTELKSTFLKSTELVTRHDFNDDDFTMENINFWQLGGPIFRPLLNQTPGIFKTSSPWHLSYFDRVWLDGMIALGGKRSYDFNPVGIWLPFFYSDQKHTFFVLPLTLLDGVRSYYPRIKKDLRDVERFWEERTREWLKGIDLTTVDLAKRKLTEDDYYKRFRIEAPPYSDDQLRDLVVRDVLQTIHLPLAESALERMQSCQFYFKNFYHPFACDFANLVYNPLQGIPALMSRTTQLKNTGFNFAQTFQPTKLVVANDTSEFSKSDIVDLPSFAARLHPTPAGVSEFVKSKLSTETVDALSKYKPGSDPEPLLTGLTKDLNSIISAGVLIYDPLRFAGVSLRPETRVLMAQNPDGDDLIRLNRLLLEDAYPIEILKFRSSYPKEEVDFSPDGAYSSYNWELFFHAPLLIANSLSKNQRFEEARLWYHFIFNPLGVESSMPGGSPMSKFWITKPFFETTRDDYTRQRIDNILRMLAGDRTVPGYSELEDQVLDWRIYPFEPHRIANYRTVAYQKTVVMEYLDNLIAWGDNLFRQDSMESINEATQLYILAAEILGPRPKKIPPKLKPPVESFNELERKLDKFTNALVQVENLIPPLAGDSSDVAEESPLPMLYFCLPQNDKILGYWDTVADRLYKIRHCLNIEGVARQLALFEPPIDPAALVKAIAGGVDISSALADLNAPLPLYRFNVLLQKANEVCNDVKALGSALLSALEKKDAEALSLLRQGLEIRLLEAVKAVREEQINEARNNSAALKRSKVVIETRRDYYGELITEDQSEREKEQLAKLEEASTAQKNAQEYSMGASIANTVPSFSTGFAGVGGSPKASISFGGSNVGSALQAVSAHYSSQSSEKSFAANKASILGTYDRRVKEWKFQQTLALTELEQIQIQIAAAELREAIAQKELDNHLLQIENAKATDAFMRSKYTSQELYQWQVGQISGVYFQSYKLAYDLAKRAERGFRFELGLQDSSFISFGYWDSLKKGLLSGEKLQYDLRRLEAAYIERNRREFELTKNISLMLLDPIALVKLRETGRCFFTLPEEVFDLDFPGHYFRRIKSVSLTIPCVAGPYTTISCTARLLKNSIRINTANGDKGYPRNTDDRDLPADDPRFVENNIPVKAMAASSSQNDSGVFELNFRDERYLPCEGAGVISDWSLELFNDSSPGFGKALRQFDYDTITDAVIHIKYTAREDAGSFKNAAVAHLAEYFKLSSAGTTPSLRLLNLRTDFPSEWQRFLTPTPPATTHVFNLEVSYELFAFRDMGKSLRVNSITLLARCDNGYTVTLSQPPPAVDHVFVLAADTRYGGLQVGARTTPPIDLVPASLPIKWQLTMTGPAPFNVEYLLLVLGYEWHE